ncbi:zinc finger protein 518A [Lampris incognitus]|uniref:zinc finger protein 518A n=1 Tax=Lampris incognitus TaxID=2546036 RepID=UPI0024B619BF|nr:zinc finger protein 518A [Lampris incognitus]
MGLSWPPSPSCERQEKRKIKKGKIMEEIFATPNDSSKNGNIPGIHDEKEEIKDFVCKQLKEVVNQSSDVLPFDPEECYIEESLSPTKTDKKTLKKSPCKVQQGAVFSGKILSFGCSVCKDNLTYSPNDLLKHFHGTHQGTLPTYPCDLCGFVTNEFPALQRHRIGHRNTLVTCEICNDDVQYSLLLLTRHYNMCHSLNGHFHCEQCEFTTVDAGTFVQHIHHHNESHVKPIKHQHVNSNHEEYQKCMNLYSGTSPFTCQVCGYGAVGIEFLKKHMVNAHGEETEKSKDFQWMSKLNCLPESVQNKHVRFFKPESSLEETGCFVDKTEFKMGSKILNKSSHNREQSACQVAPFVPLPSQEPENCSGSETTAHSNSNGLTVLMVKNKISIPPNCTTRVMGFKMVDGKKHLVLKVIPTAKAESFNHNLSSVDDIGSAVCDESKLLAENGKHTNINHLTSPFLAVSQRGESCFQAYQDDVMAVKVKVEEDEAFLSHNYTSLQKDEVGEQDGCENNRWSESSTFVDLIHPMAKESDHLGEPSDPDIMNTKVDTNSRSLTVNDDKTSKIGNISCPVSSTDKFTDIFLLSKLDHDILLPKPVCKTTVESCGSVDPSVATDIVADNPIGTNKESAIFNNRPTKDKTSQNTLDMINSVTNDTKQFDTNKSQLCTAAQHDSTKQSSPVLQLESPSASFNNVRGSATSTGNNRQNSPHQEVFNFHNYSKETFSISSYTNQTICNLPEISPESNGVFEQESSLWTLTLAESLQTHRHNGNGEVRTAGSNLRTQEEDIEIDECIASVEDQPTEESLFQEFNIIKIEEENIPVCKKQPSSKSSSASLGRVVEEHSDAIITHQLNKERTGSSASRDSVNPTKSTLRILQVPEAKQQMFLQTVDNRYALPFQLKGNPGFKLMSKSSGPQINVSHKNSEFERSSNSAGVVLTPNSGKLGMSTPVSGAREKGATQLSAVQSGASSSTSPYIINSTCKGPLLFSGATNCKTVKTQPTCYLVHRSFPVVQAPTNPSLKISSSQVPLSSCPVLTMPMNSADKSVLQTGRQAILVRYISPAKSGILVNSLDGKTLNQSSQTVESAANKVVFKIVTPTVGVLSSGAPTSTNQSLFLATRPQSQCFLVSSTKSNANNSTGVRKFIPIQNVAQKQLEASSLLVSQPNVKVKIMQNEGKEIKLAPRPVRPPSQRKRRRKTMFDEIPVSMHKARRLASKTLTEKETPELWQPVAKEVERTLRICPFSSLQQVKCPRRYQPVVVLNHPDADIPEVASIMRSVNRYRGAIIKVSLSQKTVQALSELNQSGEGNKSLINHNMSQINGARHRPVHSFVCERFLLKLKLKKKSKKKYEVVTKLSRSAEQSSVFDCWFCGRRFNSQEDWIGHGQRHLMEATRDWNKLF